MANWSPTRGDQLYLIHHPLAMKKQYSGSCRVGIGKPNLFPNWVGLQSARPTLLTNRARMAEVRGLRCLQKTGKLSVFTTWGTEYDPVSLKLSKKAVLYIKDSQELKPELRNNILTLNKSIA